MPESRSRFALLIALAAATGACQSQPLDNEAIPAEAVGGAAADNGAGGGAAESEAGGGAAGEPVVIDVLQAVQVSSDDAAEHVRRAVAEVDFGDEPVTRASLRVTLESPCFPFSKWAEQVPKGQRWPEHCDAFDRTLSVALDEPADATDESALPAVELLRAITAFGGPLQVEADITDVVNGLPGVHELALGIDTWSDAQGLVSGSKGEWIASVEVSLWRGPAPRQVLAVLPLVRAPQTEVSAAPLQFEVPAGTGSARLEYRVTGHGAVFSPGCLGPAEEFCRRTHELRLDGELLAELSPWRDDCSSLCSMTGNDSGFGPATYCAENPCGDPNSVRAPRANWCPGSMTPPFVIEAPALTVAGQHELLRRIPELAKGGLWTVSATYFAFE